MGDQNRRVVLLCLVDFLIGEEAAAAANDEVGIVS